MPESAMEKIRRRAATLRIQSFLRMVKGYRVGVDLAWRTWEKLYDSKQNAYYYYNKNNKTSQWFRPFLLGTIQRQGDLPLTDYDYFSTLEYLSSRSKVHQITPAEAEDVAHGAFTFGDKFSYSSDDDETYVVLDVPREILQPPGEWHPDPHPDDFGDTGLLSATTGDSSKWTCPACKYVNRAGLLRCEICDGPKPREGDQQVEVSALQMLKRLKLKGLVDGEEGGEQKKASKRTGKRRGSIFRPNEDNQTNATHLDDRIGGHYLETDKLHKPVEFDTTAQEQVLALANDMVSAIDQETKTYDTSEDDENGDSDSDNSSEDSFDGTFGIQDPPNIYVVFNPPLASTDSELSRLRNRNQRDRKRAEQRALRSKEMIVLTECEHALDSTNTDTVKRACRMADALVGSVGIENLTSDLLRTFVELRRWGRELGIPKKKIDGLYPSGKADAPRPSNFRPCCWRRQHLVGSYMNMHSKSAQDVLHYGRDGPVKDDKASLGAEANRKKKALFEDEEERGETALLEYAEGKGRDLGANTTSSDRALMVDKRMEAVTPVQQPATTRSAVVSCKTKNGSEGESKVEEAMSSMYGSLGGPTEEEIAAANLAIFGVPEGRLGRIMRINIHEGPGDHLGQRYAISEGDADLNSGYHQFATFFAWSFPYPGTTKYDVFTKTDPVWRSKVSSDQVTRTRHRPKKKKVLTEGLVASDDKQLGWNHELTFYAFYNPVPAACRYYVSEMYNPYRNKLTLSSARGGWAPLFNMFAFPGRMYTVFQMTRPRAEPNEDETINLYQVSPEQSLPDGDDGKGGLCQWVPQFSFYGCESKFPGTIACSIQQRMGKTGDLNHRVSNLLESHNSRVIDEIEKTTVEWSVTEQFYGWSLPVRGTVKIYCQVAKRPLRYKVTREFPVRPWRSLLAFYAPVHPQGWLYFKNAKRTIPFEKDTRDNKRSGLR